MKNKIEVEFKKVKKIVEQQERVIKLNKNDIDSIIKDKLEMMGCRAKHIRYVTKAKYVEDEWGMNRHLTSSLEEIIITLEG